MKYIKALLLVLFFLVTTAQAQSPCAFVLNAAGDIVCMPLADIGTGTGTGPQGPQGIPGITGAQGLPGPQGPAGANGAAGSQGLAGPQGATGTQGVAGVAGPAGSAGATGPAGVAGAQGLQGVQGVAGLPGAIGPAGPQGPSGSGGSGSLPDFYNVVSNSISNSICNTTTNDTATFQALINGVPDYSTIYIPTGKKCAVTGLIVNNRLGLIFRGGGNPATAGDLNGQGAAVLYHSTGALGGVVFSIDGSRDLVFETFIVDTSSRADWGFKFAKTSATGPNIITNTRFSGMSITNGIMGAGRPNWIGIDYCGTGDGNNCEDLVVDKASRFDGHNGAGSIAIKIGHGNSFTNLVEGAYIGSSHIGILNQNGTIKISRVLLSHNDIDISSYGMHTNYIEFNRSEDGDQFFYGNGIIVMTSNEIPAPAGTSSQPHIYMMDSNAGSLTMIGNRFAGSVPTFRCGDSTKLTSINNFYDPSDVNLGKVTSMATCLSGYVSIGDSTQGKGITDDLTR